MRYVLVALVVALAAGCTPGVRSGQSSGRQDIGPDPAVFVLLANSRLVAYGPATGERLGELAIDGAPASGPGHLLAADRERRLLYLVVGSTLVSVDARTLAIRARYPLPRDTRHRTVVIGPKTGTIFVIGDRADGGGTSPWLTRLDAGGTPLGSEQLRSASGRNWQVYSATITAAEDTLVISYHGDAAAGGGTTGADLLGIDGSGSLRQVCARPSRPESAGCLAEAHGTVVALAAGGVAAATGDGGQIVFAQADGRVVDAVDPGLPNNHLMEIAVTPDDSVYALGSCVYTGGLSRLRRTDERATVLVEARRGGPALCGERLSVGPASLIAVARGPSRAALLLVDGTTGRVTHEVPAEAEPLDVVVL